MSRVCTSNYIYASKPRLGTLRIMRRLAALLATVALSTAPVASADPTVEPTPAPSPDTTSVPSTQSAVPSTEDGSAPPPAEPTQEPTGTENPPPSTDGGSEPVQTPPDTPPGEEHPTQEPPHDNLPVATTPHQRSLLETLLLKPHFTAPVESAATGQNIPIAQCHRVRGSLKATPPRGRTFSRTLPRLLLDRLPAPPIGREGSGKGQMW